MGAVLLALLLPAIAGCRETHHCEGPYSYQNGECLPRGDGGPRIDTGIDGSASDDAAIDDAGDDALGPCAACGDGSVCYDGTLDAGHSVAHAPGCVQCVSDTDCDLVTLSDAGSPLGTTICDDYVCVRGCRTDTQCGAMGVCRPDHRCSAFSSGTDVCLPCDTDGNCTSGRCVQFDNAGHAGSYCLSTVAEFGACGARRRFSATLTAVTTVDGVAADDYCVPSNAITCEAVLAYGHSCASTACPDTATCVGTACTYACDPTRDVSMPNADCPAGHTCPGATSLCL